MASYQVMLASNAPSEEATKEQLCIMIAKQGIHISQLEQENSSLRARNKSLEADNEMLRNIIKKNELEIDSLKNQVEMLIKRVNELETEKKSHAAQISDLIKHVNECEIENKSRAIQIGELTRHVNECESEKKLQAAVMKLHQCHGLVRETFEDAYRKWFEKDPYEPVPSIGKFLRKPPKDTDKENHKFWTSFLKNYPGTDNKHYQNIYATLNDMRAPIAHPNIKKLSPEEFDSMMKMVFPDYDKDVIYRGYKDWLYLF